MKEIHIKTINNYLSMEWIFVLDLILTIMKIWKHLFYTCFTPVILSRFWNRTHNWLHTKSAMPAFDYLMATFGILMHENNFDFFC